ncbi:MAG: branched-chain amino acid ABC transporter permease [Kineosporiaceae bacterium]
MTRAFRALIVALGLFLVMPVAVAGAATPEDAEPEGETINVRLFDDETREPVPDTTIRVLQGDEELDEGETDTDGLVSFSVPEPGEYDVELDVESLPEEYSGLGLAQNPFTTRVDPGTPRTVALRLVEGAGDGGVEVPGPVADIPWNTLPQLVVSGLRFGLVLALAAIGLSLVFGTTGLTNFAHGELVTFGALITFALHVVAGLPLLVATPLMLALAVGFGWLQDTAIWSRLRQRGIGLIAMMIFSIGFSFFLRYGFLYFFGGDTVFYRDFSGQAGLALGPVRVRPLDLVSMGLAVVILLAVAFALLYTRIGKATRAVSDNPALASASGIDVERVIRVVWVAGTFLAALAGMLLGLSQGMDWLLGFQILLLIFAAVVLGGLGTAFGAIVGALTVGLLIEVSTLVIPPELKNVGALAVLIIILLVRPQGLLGRRERVG